MFWQKRPYRIFIKSNTLHGLDELFQPFDRHAPLCVLLDKIQRGFCVNSKVRARFEPLLNQARSLGFVRSETLSFYRLLSSIWSSGERLTTCEDMLWGSAEVHIIETEGQRTMDASNEQT